MWKTRQGSKRGRELKCYERRYWEPSSMMQVPTFFGFIISSQDTVLLNWRCLPQCSSANQPVWSSLRAALRQPALQAYGKEKAMSDDLKERAGWAGWMGFIKKGGIKKGGIKSRISIGQRVKSPKEPKNTLGYFCPFIIFEIISIHVEVLVVLHNQCSGLFLGPLILCPASSQWLRNHQPVTLGHTNLVWLLWGRARILTECLDHRLKVGEIRKHGIPFPTRLIERSGNSLLQSTRIAVQDDGSAHDPFGSRHFLRQGSLVWGWDVAN